MNNYDALQAPEMPRRTLGRTGISVPVLALGTGGPERLGQVRGRTPEQIVSFVHRALEAGAGYLDTSPEYLESEHLLGQALREVDRSKYRLATKFRPYHDDGTVKAPTALAESLESSLGQLATDHVDVLQLHGVEEGHYDAVRDTFVPELQRLISAGKVRFAGITEKPGTDPTHLMLQRALGDDVFDVIMVGYSVRNPSARDDVISVAKSMNVGVVGMMAARGASDWPAWIEQSASRFVESAGGDPGATAVQWLLNGSEMSMTELGYRFVSGTAGVSTVLTGTSSWQHLQENMASVAAGALPVTVLERLQSLSAEQSDGA